MGFKLDGYKVGFAANKPQTINCPNCGAPVTSGRCEYCNTVIYNEDDAKKEMLLELNRLELNRLETKARELKFKLVYDEIMADLKLKLRTRNGSSKMWKYWRCRW